MKLLSLKAALYFCKSTIQLCMKYCCHLWTGALIYYLELLDQQQSRYAGLLVLHFLPLLNPWLIVKM